MKKFIHNAFQPFGSISKQQNYIVIAVWLVILFLLATVLQSPIFPTPLKIGSAFIELIQSGELWSNFITSFLFILKGMGYAIVITMLLCYLSTIAFFKPVTQFITKCRYLTFTGVVFLFTMISSTTSDLKTYLLIFGVVPYFTTSFLAVVDNIGSAEINKNYVNRLNSWEALLETVIIGKADVMFEVLRQNFAIAWMMITMIEAKAMSDGGIGTMLIKTDKYLGKLHIVFALLLFVLLMGVFFDWFLKFVRFTLFDYVPKMLRK